MIQSSTEIMIKKLKNYALSPQITFLGPNLLILLKTVKNNEYKSIYKLKIYLECFSILFFWLTIIYSSFLTISYNKKKGEDRS